MTSKVEIYEDTRGEYRWRMKASNGRIVANGGEGFTRKSSCRESVEVVWSSFNVEDLDIVELENDDK